MLARMLSIAKRAGEMEDKDKAEVKAKMGWHVKTEMGESSDVRVITTLPSISF